MTLLNTISWFISNILDLNNAQLTKMLLYRTKNLDYINDASILDATVNCVIETKKWDAFLMLSGCHGFKIDIALQIHIFVRFR